MENSRGQPMTLTNLIDALRQVKNKDKRVYYDQGGSAPFEGGLLSYGGAAALGEDSFSHMVNAAEMLSMLEEAAGNKLDPTKPVYVANVGEGASRAVMGVRETSMGVNLITEVMDG